jgi:hypothetical protein
MIRGTTERSEQKYAATVYNTVASSISGDNFGSHALERSEGTEACRYINMASSEVATLRQYPVASSLSGDNYGSTEACRYHNIA